MFTWILLFILIAVTILVGWLWVSLMRTSMSSAPYVPSRNEAVRAMVELTEARSGQRMVDLGSGDGKITLAFATAGLIADGVEIQRLLVWWSWLRAWLEQSKRRPGYGSAHFRRGDIWQVECRDYDVVALYILPGMMERMGKKLKSELKPGAKIVSYQFPLPGWTPIKQADEVYLYEVKGEGSGVVPQPFGAHVSSSTEL